jgi:hypothetical protein
VQMTRDWRVLVPYCRCEDEDCDFGRRGALDVLLGEVSAHVRQTDHKVTVTEGCAVTYGPERVQAGAKP